MKKLKQLKKNRFLIAPSILSADFAFLGQEVLSLEKAGADWIHVDVMDGAFVPNITIGPVVINSLKGLSKLPLDVHLMIEKPDRYLEHFVAAGAKYLTVHAEAVIHLHSTLHQIRELGAKAGVSINPSTPIESLIEILPFVDLILVMSVNPGFGGQKFIETSYDKIRKLAQIRYEKKYRFLIEVDGGVSETNVAGLAAAGADVFVAGSAIFGAASSKKRGKDFTVEYSKVVSRMKDRLNQKS